MMSVRSSFLATALVCTLGQDPATRSGAGQASPDSRSIEELVQEIAPSARDVVRRAFDAIRAGDLVAGEQRLREALRLAEDEFFVHYQLALLLQKSLRFKEAAQEASRAVELSPDFASAYELLGDARFSCGDYRAAVDAHEQALRRGRSTPELYYSLGRAYAKQRMLDEASRALVQALKLNPRYAAAYAELGRVYFLANKLDAAQDAIRQALALDPSSANAHYYLGRLFYVTARYDDALKELMQATVLDPRFSGSQELLGSTLQRLERHEEAVAAFRRALATEPGAIGARYQLARSLHRLGRREEAEREMEVLRKLTEQREKQGQLGTPATVPEADE